MLSKCANPECSETFLYFRGGKLFRWDGVNGLIEQGSTSFGKRPARKVEFFWLCRKCAKQYTVVFRPGRGVTVRLLAAVHKAAS
jgi:hypothetical protein